MFKRSIAALILIFILIAGPLLNSNATVQAGQQSSVRDELVERIKDEEMNRSQYMEILSHLTEEIGPRLTNSPNFRKAATWTKDQLSQWGLQNAHLEPWGPFGRGWSLQRFSAEVTSPNYFPLIAYPKAWSPSTKGEVTADVVFVDAKNEADLQKYKGTLKGKIVLASPPRAVEAHFEPTATRWTDEDMLKYAMDEPYPPDNPVLATPPSKEQMEAARFAGQRFLFIAQEGAAVVMTPSPVADGGTIQVMSAAIPYPADTPREKRLPIWNPGSGQTMPQIAVAAEHYNRMVRMIQHGVQLKMSVNIAAQYHNDDLMSTHTIAEIPGTDLKDEVVMIGAHLDSWHAGTGATDNGAGVALMMETVRLLQTLKLQPRRTIRIALWGGEETAGGSRYYVQQHFGKLDRSTNPPKLVTTPEYDKFSAYYNFDAGTGKVRGVFLANNEGLRPIFRTWLKPFVSMGAGTLTANGDWGSDFVWFDEINLPIVNFIQDEIEYETRTHHTNQDVLDRIQIDDMKQAAIITTYFVYQTAMRDQKLPHKTK